MKRLLKSIFGGTVDRFFISKAQRKLKAVAAKSTVYFFDIDNTLADTKGTRHLTSVKPFPEMIKLVKESKLNGHVFFLSARNIITYRSTAKWLKAQGFENVNDTLIFLTDPAKKIKVLSKALDKNLNVIFYDDLCYNHENGEVKKYESIINEIKKLGLTYRGIEDFRHLQ